MAVYLGRAGFSVTKMLPFDTLQNGANLRKKKNNPKLAQVSPQVNINEVNSHVIEAILGSADLEPVLCDLPRDLRRLE